MRLRYKNLTQTQIGQIFGVSSHVVGDWLAPIGLCDKRTKRPTAEAHRGGYCETAPSGQAGYHWVWNGEKALAALRNAGHQLVEELPEDLVHPPALEGAVGRRQKRRRAPVRSAKAAQWPIQELNRVVIRPAAIPP